MSNWKMDPGELLKFTFEGSDYMAIPTSIKTLLSGDVVEWARIEFKETWDAAASLKSICAFANDLDNWGGGYIVIGVQENNGRPVFPLKGVPTEKLDLISSITGFENKSGTVRYEGTMQLEKIEPVITISVERLNIHLKKTNIVCLPSEVIIRS